MLSGPPVGVKSTAAVMSYRPAAAGCRTADVTAGTLGAPADVPVPSDPAHAVIVKHAANVSQVTRVKPYVCRVVIFLLSFAGFEQYGEND
jgi:hypothetical protein